MRTLAIGYPLPDVSIDNYSILTAPSFYDYDALFVDPESITRDAKLLLDGEKNFDAHDGRPVVNGATTASSVSAADQIMRRTEETERLLESGGTVIVMARPNAVQPGIQGFEGCDRFSWLPAPAGLSWGPSVIKRGEGSTINIVDDAHPLATILRTHRRELSYRAVFNDRQPEVRTQGSVIAATGAGLPVAIEFPVLAGRVIFMPVLKATTGNPRMKVAASIAELITQVHGTSLSERAPAWARSLAVPGLEQVEAELEEAEAAVKDATERADDVRSRQLDLARHRRLLWADGQMYAEAVRAALEIIGFHITSKPGDALVVEADGENLFVEVESAREEVVEWPYIRLQRRLEEHLLKRGRTRKGLVVVNGDRRTAPGQRKRQYTAPLETACQNYGYCLITGETLFALVQRALGGSGDAALTAIRRRITGHAGALDIDAATAATAEPEKRDSGSIF